MNVTLSCHSNVRSILSKTSTTRFILRDVSRNRCYGELKQETGVPTECKRDSSPCSLSFLRIVESEQLSNHSRNLRAWAIWGLVWGIDSLMIMLKCGGGFSSAFFGRNDERQWDIWRAPSALPACDFAWFASEGAASSHRAGSPSCMSSSAFNKGGSDDWELLE